MVTVPAKKLCLVILLATGFTGCGDDPANEGAGDAVIQPRDMGRAPDATPHPMQPWVTPHAMTWASVTES